MYVTVYSRLSQELAIVQSQLQRSQEEYERLAQLADSQRAADLQVRCQFLYLLPFAVPERAPALHRTASTVLYGL